MKVTSFYYLEFPNFSPVDPTIAKATMYVEVGEDRDDTSHFVSTYQFVVYTYGYITQMINQGRILLERNFMLVPSLDDKSMSEYLNAHIALLREKGKPL